MALETLEIHIRVDAPDPENGAAHSREAANALNAAVDAAQEAVKNVPGVTYVGVGYGIPRRRSWRAAR